MAQKKPDIIIVGPIRARAIRGPREERWYWRAEMYSSPAKGQRSRGKTIWRGWGTRDEATEAIIAEAQHRNVAPAGSVPLDTVGHLVRGWLAHQEDRADLAPSTVRAYGYFVDAIVDSIGSVKLAYVHGGVLERHRDERLRAGAAPLTVRGELMALCAAWRWGQPRGHCPPRTLEEPRLRAEPRGPKRTPTPAEVAEVVGAIRRPWARLMVRLLWGTGARLGDIATLTWGQVDLDRAELILYRKTGPRTVPISAELVEELAALEFGRDDDRVLDVTQDTAMKLQDKIDPACKRTGVRRFTPNGLRRLAVDTFARAGVDVAVAAAILGNSPATIWRSYRQVGPDERRLAVARAQLGVAPEGKVIAIGGTATRTKR
jgi:integrase